MLLSRYRRATLAAAALWLGISCGARSELRVTRTTLGEAGQAGAGGQGGDDSVGGSAGAAECVGALDCPLVDLCARPACVDGECVPQPGPDCSDGDACTMDSCDPQTGACVHVMPADADGDGYFAIVPDAPGCGADCDDAEPNTHPLAAELCDGSDNDCDGAIDDNTALGYAGFEPVRISALELSRAARGGLARSDASLALTYTGLSGSRFRSYVQGIDGSGTPLAPAQLVSEINADTYAGPLSWSGDAHGSAWSDARQDGNYEIYFSRFSAEGQKLTADIRLSDASGFSLHPIVVASGDQHLVAWDDRRFESGGGPPLQILALAVDGSGSPGALRTLTADHELAEYPSLAMGDTRVGMAYTVLEGDGIFARFRTFDQSLENGTAAVDLGGSDVQEPSVAHAGGHFVVAWQVYGSGPGDAIYVAIVSEQGELITPATAVTSGATFARSHSLVSLGDRFVLVWADDLDGNYELYAQTLDVELNVLRPRERLTFNSADTLFPVAAVGPDGGIGILFDDWRSGARHVYFTRLECTAN